MIFTSHIGGKAKFTSFHRINYLGIDPEACQWDPTLLKTTQNECVVSTSTIQLFETGT